MIEPSAVKAPLDAKQIQALLPHRYPFLLVDRVLELEPGKTIKAVKLVTNNEPWTQGHFPGNPMMPGVLIFEALAQAGAIILLALPEYQGKLFLLAGIKNSRIKRPVVPGDVLTLESQLHRIRMGVGFASGLATVNGEVAAKADITFAIVDKPEG